MPIDVDLPGEAHPADHRPEDKSSLTKRILNLLAGLVTLAIGWAFIDGVLFGDVDNTAAGEPTVWLPPTRGTWTCDNISRRSPWQVWTLYPEGRFSYRIAGAQLTGTGQYRWQGRESIVVEDAEGGIPTQEWMVLETEGRNWLMTNGQFVVHCHR